ncbi:hypothetical protein U8527_06705 [Kordia algicida OT-1]|uniref:Uncharacterized protein n=1 Tax=Kordia algicida OT-1 TaxID=391587 RepID=A9CU98_9FLAO|nr:hypothetical protein [Kordia algicida]EDP94140.1 hypothetical protein KAOT1_00130 [Kordia algicida OT-1]
MKKLLLACLLLIGINFTIGCEPDNLAEQEYEEIQSADKEKTGSIGNTDGEDEDEDYN